MLRWMVVCTALLHCSCAPLSHNQNDVQRKQGDRQHQARVRSNLGLAYLQQGQTQEAHHNLQQAMRIAPNDIYVQGAMLTLLETTEQVEAAQVLYHTALKQHPRHVKLLHNYGTFLCKHGDVEGAMHYFEQALQQQPTAETYENRARCAAKNDRLDEAVAHLRHLVRLSPAKAYILLEFGHWFMEYDHADYVPSIIQLYQRVAPVNADFLWLQLKFAALNGDHVTATKFGEQLVMLYPFSQRTKRYQAHEY